jgi:release factor glutamine methyltransferase
MDNISYLKKYYQGNIEDALKRLENNEPVQYIVGNVDFLGNIINVNKNVLIPRFETELLVEKTKEYISKMFNQKINILDIGTGSGCIAIALKKDLDCNIDAVDISNQALETAKENALLNKVDINFIHSDIFNNITNKYDVLISNPPYIAYKDEVMDVVVNNEPVTALYAANNGLYFYEQILKEAETHLNDKYLIAFEIGDKQAEAITLLANKYLNNIEIFIENDLNDRNRYIFIKKS